MPKKKHFKPKQQTHYIEERTKQDARLKICLRGVDEMEYFTQLDPLQLSFGSKIKNSLHIFNLTRSGWNNV